MRTIETKMLHAAVGSGALAAWLLLCDAEWIPARFSLMSIGGIAFHWQVFLALTVVLVAARDQMMEMHCRCCGSHDHLSWRALVKSREILCTSCLAWDPGVAEMKVQVQPEYADLFDALK